MIRVLAQSSGTSGDVGGIAGFVFDTISFPAGADEMGLVRFFWKRRDRIGGNDDTGHRGTNRQQADDAARG